MSGCVHALRRLVTAADLAATADSDSVNMFASFSGTTSPPPETVLDARTALVSARDAFITGAISSHADDPLAMASAAWTLRFACALGAVNKTAPEAVSIVADAFTTTIAAARESTEHSSTTDNDAGQGTNGNAINSTVSAWNDFSTVILRQLDLHSGTALAGKPGLQCPPVAEALARRNRRLAIRCRTLLSFCPPMPASAAVFQLTDMFMKYFVSNGAAVLEEATVYAAARTVLAFGLHPLRAVHTMLEVIAALPNKSEINAKLPVVFAVMQQLAGRSPALVDALLCQALGHRFTTVRTIVAAAVLNRSGATGARPAAGSAAAKELAVTATTTLFNEVVLLAKLVRAGLLTWSAAWTLMAEALPHTDFSNNWFMTVKQYGEELVRYGAQATTDVILDPKAVQPDQLGSSQIIGNKFALLTFPAPKPTWGLTFAVSSTIVPKMTAASLAVALLRVGCLAEVEDLLLTLRVGTRSVAAAEDDANGNVAIHAPPAIDLLLCPNSATPAGNLGSSIATVVMECFIVENDGALASMRYRWEAFRRLLLTTRSAWVNAATLHTLCLYLNRALTLAKDHGAGAAVEAYWQGEVYDFCESVIFPSLVTLPPSPMLSRVIVNVISLLPYDTQRELALSAEQSAQDDAVNPWERIELLRHRTLLNHCLNRVNSAEPRAFAGLLGPVFYALPLAVASRLLTKAIGYSTADLLLTNALLVRDAPPLFFWALQTLALERCLQAATKEDASALNRVTAVATFIAFVWRHNWAAVDGMFVLTYVHRALSGHRREGIVVGTLLLRQIYYHMLHIQLDHLEHRNHQQEAHLAAGPIGKWYAAGAAESFMARWARGIYTPRMLRKHEKAFSELMLQKNGGEASTLQTLVLEALLVLRFRIMELYQDLPGSTDDVLRLSMSELDVINDLVRCTFNICFDGMPADKRPSSLSFNRLSFAPPSIAVLLCNETSSWRDGPSLDVLTSANSSVALEFAQAFGVQPSNDADAHLMTLFWSLRLGDIAGEVDAAYHAAAQRIATFNDRSNENAKRRKEDRAHGGADRGSSRREFEDETSALQAESQQLSKTRAVTQQAFQAFGSKLVDNGQRITISPTIFAHNFLLQRCRLSSEDALFAAAFLSRLTQRDIALGEWVVDCICAFITGIATLFVGLTGGEVQRVGTAVRRMLEILEAMRDPELDVRKRRVELEAFITQLIFDMLASDDVPAFVHRNTFTFLEKIKTVFPSEAESAHVISVVAQVHAKPSNALYASASSTAFANQTRATAHRNALAARIAQSATGPIDDDVFATDPALTLAAYLNHLLADVTEAAHLLAPAEAVPTAPAEGTADEAEVDAEGEAAVEGDAQGQVAGVSPDDVDASAAVAEEDEFVMISATRDVDGTPAEPTEVEDAELGDAAEQKSLRPLADGEEDLDEPAEKRHRTEATNPPPSSAATGNGDAVMGTHNEEDDGFIA
jgi:hypothetical protein